MSPYIRLVRPFTLLTPAVGVAVGGYAAWCTVVPSISFSELVWRLAGVGAAASLLNAGSNVLNQICDLRIDRIVKPKRPLPSGEVSIGAAWAFTAVLYVAAIGLALAVTSSASSLFATAVLFGTAALLTVAYSAPPLRWRRFGWWANITIAIPRGFLLAPAGAAVLPVPYNPVPFCIGLVPCLFLIGAASTKDFADVEGDRADGCQTLPVKYGLAGSAELIEPFLDVPFMLMWLYALVAVWSGCFVFAVFDLSNEWAKAAVAFWPGIALLVGGVVLFRWGYRVGTDIRRDPEALGRDENHPAWKSMYLMMLCYYGTWVVALVPYMLLRLRVMN
jgi:4-hydroxybenzoate polyprenyltransferase